MPDEAFKAMIVAGAALILVSTLTLFSRPSSESTRRLMHWMLLVGGTSLAGGIVISAVREDDKLSQTAVLVVALAALVTACLHGAYIVTRSRRIGLTALVLTAVSISSAIVMASTYDKRDCGGCSPTTTLETDITSSP